MVEQSYRKIAESLMERGNQCS